MSDKPEAPFGIFERVWQKPDTPDIGLPAGAKTVTRMMIDADGWHVSFDGENFFPAASFQSWEPPARDAPSPERSVPRQS